MTFDSLPLLHLLSALQPNTFHFLSSRNVTVQTPKTQLHAQRLTGMLEDDYEHGVEAGLRTQKKENVKLNIQPVEIQNIATEKKKLNKPVNLSIRDCVSLNVNETDIVVVKNTNNDIRSTPDLVTKYSAKSELLNISKPSAIFSSKRSKLLATTVLFSPIGCNKKSKAMSTPNPPIGVKGSYITGHKLNGQNYLQWSQPIRMYICCKGKDDFLTSAFVAPSPEGPKYKIWNAENYMVMSWLINSMTNEIRRGELAVTQYFNTLARHWQQVYIFDVHQWACKTDAELHQKINEQRRTFKFLFRLNSLVDNVLSRILNLKLLSSMREAFAEVHYEESKQKIMLGMTIPAEASALATHQFQSRLNNDRSHHDGKPKSERHLQAHVAHNQPSAANPEQIDLPMKMLRDLPRTHPDQKRSTAASAHLKAIWVWKRGRQLARLNHAPDSTLFTVLRLTIEI
ncbi:hypothetical protein ZIOFF_004464 [Zingiber officinale]|uniref:Retrotransposon Copia-like N-terminal domain-containing protein n=1 Tax=Zingiber officinale TaxID=94328 RepID=A0A8J5I112_ZINOF|nr:hypothetical protein ZIOFF_004464 [Zingiber officinale]